ncbi:MAG TPA: pyruvate flavodoxin/ferredoxin oxidoreductase [Acidimicrobiia bacterium]|nr:pyruvate flavodoxin/ferredoxin oxidoreductase [Acidimicrobiia bacterium]
MREFIDGNTAIVRAALDSGCTFFAGYPITPASSILMAMMSELPRIGGVAIQGEDEIASIGMCIGATLAGARAMTATSGPGISLYSENVGLAIMGEVPLVIVDVQRLGPSTGGATTVSQGDVQFVRWGTAGGFPIIALSPSTVPEAYVLTAKAFDLAERFRCPVFLVTDKELATTLTTVDLDAYPRVEVRSRLTGEEGPPYRFHPVDGVSPLHEFGRGTTVRFTGSTHDEAGFITKHPPTVDALNRHLTEKIEAHREEIEMVDADCDAGAATLVLGYGITGGAVRAAVATARSRGERISGLVVQTLWPVPETAIGAALAGVDRVIVPELNPGLYRREIERIAGGRTVIGVERVDGELISPEQILAAAA